MKAPGKSLAGFLLPVLGTALALAAGACLAPQDIEEYVPPTLVNRPPEIDIANGVSPTSVPTCVSPDDDVQFLVSNIRDPNAAQGQTLEVRWFLDYSPSAADSFTIIRTDRLVPLSGSDIYPDNAQLRRRDLGALSVGVHALEVVISDGFDNSGETEPPNRAPARDHYAVSYKWVIEEQVAKCAR